MDIWEKKVLIDFGCFANMICASIESYDTETFGLIGGENKKNGLRLMTAPPLLSAEQGEDFVDYLACPEKYELAKALIDDLGLWLVGDYHSHPNAIAHPSEDDLITCLNDIKTVREQNISTFDWWLQLIISIERKDYKRNFKPVFIFDDDDDEIQVTVKRGKVGWKIHIMGHWCRLEELKEGDWCQRKDAKLSLNKKTYPSSWEF
ncbi:Mov34/MPN/PAD-1 family protein [Methanolobus bombayensis]|uniref:Mov34/MPN/PAD-1 family protein n=1 Tax=Methanolobus bombayensis TaxID=38023 RepID=UPI001AE38FE7|nr:Mov34/MPN/PAD-1 family protein [Methanolobus bombayensis]MBP1909190.1 proteasome lid subunit RPN8/RPN11 [Methanolobus bombayensis]